MKRLAHLESLYLKIVYTALEEEKQTQPSEAVLEACAIAKRVIYREHSLLAQRINPPSTQVLQ